MTAALTAMMIPTAPLMATMMRVHLTSSFASSFLPNSGKRFWVTTEAPASRELSAVLIRADARAAMKMAVRIGGM